VAGATGFEPAIFGLTGRYVRPLHHAPTGINDTTETHFRQTALSHWSNTGGKNSKTRLTVAWQLMLALKP
jgi:hypothetical protein